MANNRGSDKETRDLISRLRKQGFKVNTLKSGHSEVLNAQGETVAVLAGTGSDPRGWKNALSNLRAAGYIDPKRPHKKKEDRDPPA